MKLKKSPIFIIALFTMSLGIQPDSYGQETTEESSSGAVTQPPTAFDGIDSTPVGDELQQTTASNGTDSTLAGMEEDSLREDEVTQPPTASNETDSTPKARFRGRRSMVGAKRQTAPDKAEETADTNSAQTAPEPTDQTTEQQPTEQQSTTEERVRTPLTNSDDFEILCTPNIGTNIDIVHFPMERWTETKDSFKSAQEVFDVVQETTDDVIDFIFNEEEEQSTQAQEDNQSPPIVETIARPQFALASLIKHYPYGFVFHEFVTRIHDTRELNNFTYEKPYYTHPDQLPNVAERSLEDLFHITRAMFPDGLPEKYTDLTKEQKYTLAVVGGAHTLFFLNELPMILPSISKTDYHRIFQKPNNLFNIRSDLHYETLFCETTLGFLDCSDMNYEITLLKEEYMTQTVNSFLDAFPRVKNPIILIYDGDTDLNRYFPDQNIFRVPDRCFK